MKKGLFAGVVASAVFGAASLAFAGAYGEAEEPEEIPAPAPAVAPEPEPEPPLVMRKWAGFLADAETARGLRAEIGSAYAVEYHPSSVGDVEASSTYAHIAYGQELFEVGLFAPLYIWSEQDSLPFSRDGFGDLRIWGKVLPVRSEKGAFGGGLIVGFPTGSSEVSEDEYNFEPFLAGQVMAGDASIRLSVGYYVTTAPGITVVDARGNLRSAPDDLYDRLNTNFAVLYPVSEQVVVRGEIEYQHFVGTSESVDPVSIYPGVDVTFPLGDVDLILRPSLGIGVHHAPDWQVGLGIAVDVPGV